MNKFKFLVFSLLLFIISPVVIFAKTPTLEQISLVFNNHTDILNYQTNGTNINSSILNNKLVINSNNNETLNIIDYSLNGNILSGSFSEDNALFAQSITPILIDSIQYYQGYQESDLDATITSKDLKKYTVENEGIYYTFDQANKTYELKLDISKKIPLADFSDDFIEVSDIELFKDSWSGNATTTLNIGYIYLYFESTEDEINFSIFEKDKIGMNTYNSILSILSNTFDEKMITYFKYNYKPNDYSKSFDGFKISYNPEINDKENELFNNLEGSFLRISIDRKLAISSAANFKIEKQSFIEMLKEALTNQEILVTKKIFGLPLIDLLIIFAVLVIIIFLAQAIFLNKISKVIYGAGSVLAFIPLFNFYAVGRLAFNRFVGLLVLIMLVLCIKFKFTIQGTTIVNNIIPDNIKLYVFIAWIVIVLLLYIIAKKRYEKIKLNGGGIVLKKLKLRKNKKSNNVINNVDYQVDNPVTLPGTINDNIPTTLPVQDNINIPIQPLNNNINQYQDNNQNNNSL